MSNVYFKFQKNLAGKMSYDKFFDIIRCEKQTKWFYQYEKDRENLRNASAARAGLNATKSKNMPTLSYYKV